MYICDQCALSLNDFTFSMIFFVPYAKSYKLLSKISIELNSAIFHSFSIYLDFNLGKVWLAQSSYTALTC
jgi:hypothetical protein